MNVYECTSCGELSVERPRRVEIVNPDSDVPQWSAWLCRDCYGIAGSRWEDATRTGAAPVSATVVTTK